MFSAIHPALVLIAGALYPTGPCNRLIELFGALRCYAVHGLVSSAVQRTEAPLHIGCSFAAFCSRRLARIRERFGCVLISRCGVVVFMT